MNRLQSYNRLKSISFFRVESDTVFVSTGCKNDSSVC